MIEKAFLLKWLEHAPRALSHLYALFFILIGWAIFALEDMNAMGAYLSAMFGLNGGGLFGAADRYALTNYAAMLPVLAAASTPLGARLFGRIPERMAQVLVPLLMLAGLVLSTAYLVDATYNPFLYFRF